MSRHSFLNVTARTTYPPVLACVILAVCLPLSGCGSRGKRIRYTLTASEDAVTLTLGSTTLVFDGIEHFGKTKQTKVGLITVSGSSNASGSAGMSRSWEDGVASFRFDHSHRDGVVDLWLEGHEFQLLEEGTKLACSGQTFVIDAEPRTIRIAKDGTIVNTDEPLRSQ